jgi:hypothetical protein
MKAKHIISILFLSFLLGIASGCCQTQELKREASSNLLVENPYQYEMIKSIAYLY